MEFETVNHDAAAMASAHEAEQERRRGLMVRAADRFLAADRALVAKLGELGISGSELLAVMELASDLAHAKKAHAILALEHNVIDGPWGFRNWVEGR